MDGTGEHHLFFFCLFICAYNVWVISENIILSEDRLRRPKIACSPSYADYRTKTNAAIF
jgi:hypothetical protein